VPETQNQTALERTKELTDRLETGIQDLLQSEKYMEYLKSMSQFHRYSTRNTLLIHMQNPTATRVASFKAWDEKFNRHVKKGEKGLRVFAPIKTKVKEEFDKIDPQTKAPMLDANGKIITEELESESLRFKLVPVFDVSQTYGEPLPEIVENLTSDVVQYEAFLDAMRAVSPLPIEFEPLADNNDGYCQYGKKIGIREGMSEAQTVAAIVHEITHAKLHDKQVSPETADNKTKRMKEVEAESISYVVCQHFGIETSPNSFGYLAEWGSNDMSEFKASLDTIRKEASALITDIDERFQAICKDRGIDLSKEPEQTAPETPVTSEPSFTTEERTETIAGVEFSATDIVPEQPEEIYEITYWKKGTGIDVLHYFNEGSEKYGDYETLAHISPNRSVEFVMTDLSDEIRDKINAYAQTAEIPNMAADIPSTDETTVTEQMAEISESAEIMPDPAIGLSERDLYGYTQESLLPLTKDRALALFDQDSTVFLLYEDNTEAMAFDREEIENFDGIFGIERAEWEKTGEYAELKAQNSEAVKEPDPIHGNIDTFTIYQLKDGEELRYHRFASINQLEKDNLAVDIDNYNLVYKAPLLSGETLDEIYYQFNHAHPKGFTGHSLSVSDVVVIECGGNITSHYVDNTEFVELPAFLGGEKQQEHTAEIEANAEIDKKALPEPEPLEQKPIEKSVYRESIPYACEHGELDKYRADVNLNVECKNAIDAAIHESRYDSNFYKMKDAVKEVVDTYGAERVELIVAKIVQGADWDGRYSQQNKEWAKGFDIPQGMKDVYSNTHPCLIDGFLDKLREKPSVLETLRANAEKSRQQAEPKQDNKKSKEMEM
jgi:Domain of unknown function (DUF955).